jgi:hypothetical protein
VHLDVVSTLRFVDPIRARGTYGLPNARGVITVTQPLTIAGRRGRRSCSPTALTARQARIGIETRYPFRERISGSGRFPCAVIMAGITIEQHLRGLRNLC